MGNHFVPKYYLKSFTANDGSDFIYCFEKGKHRVFKTNIINVAQQNKLYSPEVEIKLTEDYEEPSKNIFAKIQLRENITLDEKNILTKYIIILLMRIPNRVEKVKPWVDLKSNMVFGKIIKELNLLKIVKPELAEKVNGKIEYINKIKNDNIITPDMVWQNTLVSDYYPQMQEALLKMNWVFYFTDTSRFLTCDNPVFYFENVGLGNKKQAELSLPITKCISLVVSWNDKHKGYKVPNEYTIKEINRRTVANANKFVYAFAQEPWMLSFINKTNHNIQQILE